MMRARGFTLIEMIVTILLMLIVGATIGGFIVPAVRAHQAQVQRSALVDAGESALRRMARDVRISLPNSVRITNTASGYAIEMVPTMDGGRYCFSSPSVDCNGGEVLNFGPAGDDDFHIFGCFRNSAFTGAAFPSTDFRLVIGDTGGLVYSASGSPAVVTPSGTSINLLVQDGGGAGTGVCGTSSGGNSSYRHRVQIVGGHRFSITSPRQRVFVVQQAAAPVTYICDTATQTLRRYAGYTFQAAQPTSEAAPPLSVATSTALVVDKVSACSVASTTADVQSRSLLTLTMSLSNAGETVTLLNQLQLDNSR